MAESEQIAKPVVDTVLEVHRAWGPACWNRSVRHAWPMNVELKRPCHQVKNGMKRMVNGL